MFVKRPVWIFVLIGIAAGLFLFHLTRETAVDLSPDGVGYLAAADSFLQGKGFLGIPGKYETALMVHHAPFYSILIACANLFLHDLIQSARWLDCIFYGLNIALAGFFAYSLTGAWMPALLASVLISGSPVMLQAHLGTGSEVPFISFTMLGFWFLNSFFEDSRKMFHLILGSALLSLAYFTRYAGISVVMAGVLMIWLIPRPILQPKKIFHSLLFFVISCSLMYFWGLRNKAHAETHMPWNHVGLRWDMRLTFRELFATLSIWFLPKAVPRIVRWSFLAAMGGGLALLFRETASAARKPFFQTLAIFGLVNVGIYLLFNLGVGYEMIDDRALAASFFPAAILFAVLLHTGLKEKKSARMITLAGIFLVVSAFHVARGYGWAAAASREGLGFSAKKWNSSETLAAIRKMPPETLIYTNAGDLLYIRTGRASSPLPPKEFYGGPKRFDLGEPSQIQFKRMLERLTKDDGMIVYFEGFESRIYGFSLEELKAAVPLEVVQSFSDGVVLKLKNGGPAQ